jgi:hypothetical protein
MSAYTSRLDRPAFVVVVMPVALSNGKRTELAARLRATSVADNAKADPFDDVRSKSVVIQNDLYCFDSRLGRRSVNSLSYSSADRIGCPFVTQTYHSGCASHTARMCRYQAS